ncbi:MAG: hypothetical protein ACM3O6_00695, partial [Acidobacteriota bacterium]
IPTGGSSDVTLGERLSEALGATIAFAPLDEFLNAQVLLLTGPPGAGKTTLAAKLAARRNRGALRLVAADTGRAGGLAQLREFTTALGIPLLEAETPAALAAITAGRHPLIVDAAGIDPPDAGAWAGLEPWIAAAEALPLLVLPANATVEDTITAASHFRALGGRHAVVTRFDMVRRIGGALGATLAGVPLAGVSVTPNFAYGLRPMTAEILAHRLLSGALEAMRWQAPAA